MEDNASGVHEKRHWVRLTRVCNQRCVFCHDRGAQTGEFVAFESLRRNLALGRKQGLRRVVLSGGEPTIHPRYIDLVALARKQGYRHIQTITNGRRFCYEDFMGDAVAAGLDEVTFSLHGHTPDLHDRLTRVPGSYLQAVSGLRRALRTPGLIVSVDVVINSLNLPVLRDILDFYIGLGVGEFDLLALVPFGDAWDNRDQLFCDFSDPGNLRHLHRALELSRRPDLHIWTNRLSPRFLEGFESLIQPPEKILDEVRGRRRIFSRYLNGGKPPKCSGKNCGQCFLHDFCIDLDTLKKDGSLPVRPGPLCLGTPAARSRGPKRLPDGAEDGSPAGAPSPFRFGKKPDIFSFAEFFIEYRFFAKGSACGKCALARRCDGMSVKRVRSEGFNVMKPVRRSRG